MASAFLTVSSGILLPNISPFFLRLKTDITDAVTTAKVVTFIPPAVEPEEPPISIKNIIISLPDSETLSKETVLNPAVRRVTD